MRLFRGRRIRLPQALGSYVMENVLFKISFPAEFHAQTAVEAAMTPASAGLRQGSIRSSESVIETQEPACGSSTRPGRSPIRRTVITAFSTWSRYRCCSAGSPRSDYEDEIGARSARGCAAGQDGRCSENPTFTQEYYAPDKRYIGNAVQVFFKDGSVQPPRRGGLSDRAPQAPRRRHAGADAESSRRASRAQFEAVRGTRHHRPAAPIARSSKPACR